MPVSGAQFAVHEHGVIALDGLLPRFGHRQANLGSGFEPAIPHVFAIGDGKQVVCRERHRVQRHALVRAAPTHRRHAVVIGDHLDACAPVQAAVLSVAFGPFHRHGDVHVPETAHLIADGGGLPAKLPFQAHVHQIGAADATTHGKRPGQRPCGIHTIGARFDDLDDLAGPVAVVAVVRFIQCDLHQLARQGEPHEYHTAIDVPDASSLVGITFDTHLRVHCFLSRFDRIRPVRLRCHLHHRCCGRHCHRLCRRRPPLWPRRCAGAAGWR